MPSVDQIAKLESQISERMHARGLSAQQAYESIREDMASWGAPDDALAALQPALTSLEEKLTRIDYLTGESSIRPGREAWYAGPDAGSINWAAYRKHLISKGWEVTIDSIDTASTQVVSLLNNPGKPEFTARGLVLGYVQSGKTANMTGVIAKAADAGYMLVIILTGTIEKLRQQTQARIESDLADQPDTSEWYLWTSIAEDFSQKTYPGFTFNPAHRNLMVIKKQRDVLQRIITKLENTSISGRNIPVLIIDDECDQASVNSPGRNNDWRTINRLIRQLMSRFPRHTYVGYTATPFANVLIDPGFDPARPPDLYPKDFIYSLPCPDNYFGAEKLFGRDLLDAETEIDLDEELDVIRTIPYEEIAHLKPSKDSPDFTITASLNNAINYYLLATAVRNVRGQRDKHSTMLIHTSHLKDDHRLIATEIEREIGSRLHKLQRSSSGYIEELERVYEAEADRVPPDIFGNDRVAFAELTDWLEETAKSTLVIIENSDSLSDERLDYEGAPGDLGRRYICVGGNVISRGLTLEGLVCSFFMRTSKQYDTLMQMGRWFGYRPGYEDLPRVWMTAAMQDNFYALATVEADMREKIRVYEREDPTITPMDIPVRIRQIPGLAITSRDKMYAARRVRFSFGGEHRQTTHFAHRDGKLLDANWRAGGRLFETALGSAAIETRGPGLLVRNVERSLVEQFLHDYSIHPTHADLVDSDGTNHLLEYIDKRKQSDPEDLQYWNIGIIQSSSAANTAELPGVGGIKLMTRSRFRLLENGDADIKALMSRRDISIDFDAEITEKDSWEGIKKKREQALGMNCPLLLLYPIDKVSAPARRTGTRENLDAVSHVMGMGILFPQTDEASCYVEVILPDLDPEDEESATEGDRD